jgi:hypothetical protein
MTLALPRIGMAETMRSGQDSLFRRIGLLNKPFLVSVTLPFGLQMAVIYMSAMQAVFQTTTLSVIVS